MVIIKKIFFSLFFLFAILTLSLYVFRLFGYSFSVAFFLQGLLIIFSLKHIPRKSWIIYWLLFIHQFFIVVLYVFQLNFIEFLKSLLLVNISVLGIICSKFYVPSFLFKINLKKILSFAVIIIVLFELLQVLEFGLIGTSFSWFLLDKFSISTAEDVGRFQAANLLNYMRPVSLYHEPSYLGLVLFAILIWTDSIQIKFLLKLVILSGIVMSLSTTIYLFLILYYIPKIYNNKIFIFLFFSVFLYSSIKYNVEIFDFFRLGEIAIEGTSGHERIGKPFFEVVKMIILEANYFGIPFGQSPVMFNNSFFVIFFYYGMLTPLYYLLIFGSVLKNEKDYNKIYNYFLIIGACLFVSGAFFTPETCFLIVLTNYILLHNLSSIKKII